MKDEGGVEEDEAEGGEGVEAAAVKDEAAVVVVVKDEAVNGGDLTDLGNVTLIDIVAAIKRE